MGGYKCSICNITIAGGTKGLGAHFRYKHGLLTKQSQALGWKCGETGCQCSFRTFGTLSRHLQLKHPLLETQNSNRAENVGLPMDIEGFSMEPEDNGMPTQPVIENDSPDNENIHMDISQSVTTEVVKLVACLRSNANLTGASLGETLAAVDTFAHNIVDSIRNKITSFLDDHCIALDPSEVENLLSQVEVGEPFHGYDSIDKQVQALKKHFTFVDPKEIPLGDSCELVLNKETNEYEPKLVTETFQYMPIIETLKLIMSHKHIKKHVEEEQPSSDGFMRGFRDSECLKHNPFFQKFPLALRIRLYYDDILVNNPLGSKTHGHKLGMFYFMIENLPYYLQSFLGGIHVLGICYAADVSDYGFPEILRPFLEDLAKLESDNGVPVKFHNEDYILRATISCVVADGLAAHQLFGLLNPSASLFCRLCLIHRRDWNARPQLEAELRTKELYNNQLELLSQNFISESDTGLREDSCLHKSRYWHCTENFVFDPMHDIWSGIAPVCLSLVIRHFVTKRNGYDLDVSTINNRIQMFSYGSPEKTNKPSANFSRENLTPQASHTMKQKALQTSCLLRIFPFLVSDKVPKDDEYLHLILLLNRISEIIFSPKVSASQAPNLKDFASDLVSHFKKLFPDVDLINKFHHLQHYWLCLIKSGPLRHLSCARYEAKHHDFKKYGSQCCNFKNLPMTIARLSQINQCVIWGAGNRTIRKKITCSKGETVQVKDTTCQAAFQGAGIGDTETVFHSHAMNVYGIHYERGLLVAVKGGVESVSGNPEFAEISAIFVLDSEDVFLLCELVDTVGYEMSLNAYAIGAPNGQMVLVNIDSLKDRKPFALWRDYCSENSYVVLRHVLV